MYIRRKSKFVNLASFFSINACCILFFAVVIHYFSVLNNRLFVFFCVASFLLAVVSLLFAILTLVDLWNHGYKGGVQSLRAIIYAFIVIAPVVGCVVFYRMHPLINEVTTDLSETPKFLVGCKTLENAPEVTLSSASSSRYEANISDIVTDIKTIAKLQHLKIIKEWDDLRDNDNYYIEIQRKSFPLGFISVMVVRLHQESGSIFVDMRARSCDMGSDAGISDRFAVKFINLLDDLVLIGNIDE